MKETKRKVATNGKPMEWNDERMKFVKGAIVGMTVSTSIWLVIIFFVINVYS